MILILTYAKVFTTSLHAMLSERYPGEVFRTHGLQPSILTTVDRFLAAAATDTQGLRRGFDNDALRPRLEAARRSGERIVILSGVRDPVVRSLSVAVQNLEIFFPELVGRTDAEAVDDLARALADLWQRRDPEADAVRAMAEMMIHAPLHWLQDELGSGFGLDLSQPPFDRERGFSLYERDNVALLLFRHEDAPAAIEDGLGRLFPGETFTVPAENVTATKPTGPLYARLRERFRLPRAFLEDLYAHPCVRTFYDEDEIASAIARWSAPDPAPASTGPDSPPAAAVIDEGEVRATVFIPLHNHARWIGSQLESLFSQWRPDLELLLIDDGSTDGGLAVVTEVLARHPEIAATILRHDAARGHGVLPDIVRHARGSILIQADSDDLALPGRIEAVLSRFAADPDCRLVTSNAVMISESGAPLGLFDVEHDDGILADPEAVPQMWGAPWIGAASAFHRSVIEAFAPLDPELCPYGFDLLTPLRATLLGTHHHLAHPYVAWRRHTENSHRRLGGGSRNLHRQEQYGAIELMALAQRIRDVEDIRLRNPTPSLDRALAGCQRQFMDFFDRWSRIRNRCRNEEDAGSGNASLQGGPGLPPIVTLARGRTYPISPSSAVARALSDWPGFHEVEAHHVWTSRQAAFAIRITDATARAIVIKARGVSTSPRTAYFTLDCHEPVTASLTAHEAVEVEIPLGSSAWTAPWLGFSLLIVRVPESGGPTEETGDARILGAAISEITLI